MTNDMSGWSVAGVESRVVLGVTTEGCFPRRIYAFSHIIIFNYETFKIYICAESQSTGVVNVHLM